MDTSKYIFLEASVVKPTLFFLPGAEWIFFILFLEDISNFCRILIETSGDVSSEFQSQSGQPYFHLVEVYM